MKTIIFAHQLGTTRIQVNNDGTATFRRKKYAYYKAARHALTTFLGFAYKVSEK